MATIKGLNPDWIDFSSRVSQAKTDYITRQDRNIPYGCIKRSKSHSLIGQGAHRDRSMPHTLIGGCRTQ